MMIRTCLQCKSLSVDFCTAKSPRTRSFTYDFPGFQQPRWLFGRGSIRATVADNGSGEAGCPAIGLWILIGGGHDNGRVQSGLVESGSV